MNSKKLIQNKQIMEKVEATDYYDIKRVTSIDSTEKYVVYDEKVPDKIENTYTSCLKVLNIESNEIRQFTSGTKLDHNPKFSPDGKKLAFISTRSEKPQLFVIPVDGGEATKLTSRETGIQGYNWSPDSSKIAFTSMHDPDEPSHEEPPEDKFEAERRKAEKEERERKLKDPRVVSDLVYRQGTSYLHPNQYAQLFVVDIDTKNVDQVSEGEFHHTIPSFISKTEIVSTSKREKPRDLSTKIHLVKFNIAELSEGEIIAEGKGYYPVAPVAKSLDNCYVSIAGEGTMAGQNTKWAKFEDGQLDIINEELNRSVETIKITNSGEVYVTVGDKGKVDLRRYDKKFGRFEKVFDTDVSIIDFTIVSDDEIYFTGTSALKVWAVYKWTSQQLGTGGVELIADPNSDGLSRKLLVDPEEMWFINPEGIKFQGWFFDATKLDHNEEKPPLVLSIHGGPHAMWSNGGTMMHEWQTTVNAGYSVLAINPIGSQGYGEEFSQTIVPGKWGHDDARDLLQAVDTIIDRVHPDRLYITGGSYAGFQTANIISRYHRFNAACAQRGVYNFINFGFTTDIPLWFGWEMGGTAYEKLEEYWENSPLGRAQEIETPLLIIHAENDFRVPISEAETLFTALKLQDKEVVMVRYPRDGHELSRSGEPLHVVDRIERMIDWFDRHP